MTFWSSFFRLRKRVLLAFFLPVALLLIFITNTMLSQWQLAENLGIAKNYVIGQQSLLELQNAIYKERGISLFISVRGAARDAPLLGRLKQAREEVELQFESYLHTITTSRLADAERTIFQLKEARQALALLRESTLLKNQNLREIMSGFDQLLSLLEPEDHPELYNQLPGRFVSWILTGKQLVKYTDYLGRARGVLTSLLEKGGRSDEEWQALWNSIEELKKSSRLRLQKEAPEDILALLSDLEKQPQYLHSEKLTDAILSMEAGGLLEATPENVFSMLSYPVDSVTNLNTLLYATLVENVIDEANAARRSMWIQSTLALLGAIVIIGLVRSAYTPFSKAAQDLILATIAASKGDLTVELKEDKDPELRNLQKNFNAMITALRNAAKADQQHSWLKSCQAKLSSALAKQETIHSASSLTIQHLAKALGAPQGAIFTSAADKEQRVWALQGSYGFEEGAEARKSDTLGYGLIEQCAKEASTIVIPGIPDGYFTIRSGLGEAPPQLLVVTPIQRKGRVLGVIELGLLEELTDVQQELVESSASLLAVSLSSIQETQQVKRLLEETQELSAETQLQSDELQQANDRLERSNTKLESNQRLIEQKNRDLENTAADLDRRAEELRVASKYKSDFLANMSHELRTPLNSLMLLAQLMLGDEDAPLDEDKRESMEIIYKNGKDLLHLIDDILDLAKVEAGKLDISKAEANPREVLTKIEEVFGSLSKEKALPLEIEVGADFPEKVEIDEFRVDQILKNLVSNAFKFTSEGKISVRAFLVTESSDAPQELSATTSSWYGYSVQDTGIGISGDKLNQLFAPFDQLDRGMARKYGGTGLGLAISRQLAELLGGRLTCKSSLGNGATFTLYLPVEGNGLTAVESAREIDLQTEARESSPTPPSTIDSVIKKFTASEESDVILFVDDDRSIYEELRTIIEEKGYRSLHCSRLSEAKKAVEEQQFCGIILDLNLPDGNGLALVTEWTSTHTLPSTVVFTEASLDRTEYLHLRKYVDYVVLKEGNGKLLIQAGFDRLFSRGELDKSKKSPLDQPLEEHELKGKRILIADDDLRASFALSKVFSRYEAEVVVSDSGTATLAKMQQTEPLDCLLVDLMMPNGDGFSLIRELRADKKNQTLPIIAISAGTLQEHRDKAIEVGANLFLLKPLEIPLLLKTISELINAVPEETTPGV